MDYQVKFFLRVKKKAANDHIYKLKRYKLMKHRLKRQNTNFRCFLIILKKKFLKQSK